MKRTRTKFKELDKCAKILRIIAYVVMTGVVIACIAGTVSFMVKGDVNNRIASALAMIAYAIAPLILELIFRFRLPSVLFLGIEIYLIFAGVWGSTFNGYYNFAWLDVVVHSIMGYLACLVGIYFFSRLLNYKTLKPWTIVILCFCFSMAIEGVWELCEWFSDLFLGQTAQGIPIEGVGVATITDTMEDFFCNFCGIIVFCAHFLIGKASKRSLGINAMETELAGTLSAGFIKKQQVVVDAPIMQEETLALDEKILEIKQGILKNTGIEAPKKSRKKKD